METYMMDGQGQDPLQQFEPCAVNYEVFDMIWISDSSNCFAFVCVLIRRLLRHILLF